MNGEIYIEKLDALHPLSSGLKAYISTIAQKTAYNRGQILLVDSKSNNFFPFIESGALQVSAIDKETDEKIKIGKYSEHEFLYHFQNTLPKSRFDLYVEFLEDSSIVAISEKHYANLMKLFFDAYRVNLVFTSCHLNHLLTFIIERQ